MAIQEEVVMKLVADVGDAKDNLEEVKTAVVGIGASATVTAKATSTFVAAIKGVGLALKAAGIGLAIKALNLLQDIFMQNQKTADFFNTVFEATSIAINDFVNFVFNNFGQVAEFFKNVFENPVSSIRLLGTALKNNLIERFESAIEVANLLGHTISLLVAGKFKEASVTIKEAGKEMVDVVTGVDDSTTKIAETFNVVKEAVVDYTKETINSAKANVALQKQAELSQVKIQGLIESYDRQAEKLRQVRDDENQTFEDRIKANEELGVILEEQAKQMLALQQIQVKAAQIEYDKLQNQENLIALTEAQNELLAIEAQITGFQSEQLTNQVSLQRELQDVKKELALEGVSERERELLEVEQQYEELFRLAEKSGTDITALEQRKADKLNEIRRTQTEADVDIVLQSINNIKSIMGEESKAAKALAVAETTINTYMAMTAALAPPPVGAGPVLGPILAGSTFLAGMANIDKILAVEEPYAQGGMVGGYGTGTSDSISARLSKGESVINARSTRMFKPLLSAINEAGGGRSFASGEGVGGTTMGVVKAFVVADDMTKQQDKMSKIRRKATI